MKETVFSERIESYYDVGAQEANYIRHLSDEYFRKEAEEKSRLLTKEFDLPFLAALLKTL